MTKASYLLRPWKRGDEYSLVKHANNKKIWDNLRDSFPYPFTIEEATKWIDKSLFIDPPINFVIEIDKQAVGGIGIVVKYDVYKKNAELGYWLGEQYWNLGIMTRAVKETIKYTFKTFELVRIYASVFEKNRASARVLEKAGFEKEAVLKKSVCKNNLVMNELIYSILNDNVILND